MPWGVAAAVGASVVGSALSKGGSKPSGSTTQTTQQVQEPWSVQKPYLEDQFKRAEAGYQGGIFAPATYPGQGIAPTNPYQEFALSGTAARALNGSPLNDVANNEVYRTANGDYLSAGNPYLQNLFGHMADEIRPVADSQFSSAGRYGSGAHATALTDSLTKAYSDLAYKNYTAERTNQNNAARLAPELANQDYRDLTALQGAGDQARAYQQQFIDDATKRYTQEQNRPAQNLAGYSQSIAGNYGGTTSGSSTQPYFAPSMGQNILGGALAGASLYRAVSPMFGGSNYGSYAPSYGDPSAMFGGGYLPY